MERQEFLKTLGIGFASVCVGSCLSACGGKDETGTPNNNPGPGGGTGNTVSVSISGSLPNVGNQVKMNGVLIFRIAAGATASAFVATEAMCPHQSGSLNWLSAQNKIQCQQHQAEFTSAGMVTQGPQGSAGSVRALKIYAITVSGDTLTATVV